jgi:hypothetical protein
MPLLEMAQGEPHSFQRRLDGLSEADCVSRRCVGRRRDNATARKDPMQVPQLEVGTVVD